MPIERRIPTVHVKVICLSRYPQHQGRDTSPVSPAPVCPKAGTLTITNNHTPNISQIISMVDLRTPPTRRPHTQDNVQKARWLTPIHQCALTERRVLNEYCYQRRSRKSRPGSGSSCKPRLSNNSLKRSPISPGRTRVFRACAARNAVTPSRRPNRSVTPPWIKNCP